MAMKNGHRLKGVHPDIVRVLKRAAEKTDFLVVEGLRTVERQKTLVKAGASKTMHSRHLTGHAVDIAPLVDGKLSWDWKDFHKLAPIIKEAAELEKVKLTWGGDWKNFPDGPHWEIPR